jgi:hypothetical protein
VGQDCILQAGFSTGLLASEQRAAPVEQAFKPATTAFEPAFALDQR